MKEEIEEEGAEEETDSGEAGCGCAAWEEDRCRGVSGICYFCGHCLWNACSLFSQAAAPKKRVVKKAGAEQDGNALT